MIAGSIALLGVGALGVAVFQSTVNGLNSEQDSLAARTKAIEDSRYSLPSAISSDISATCSMLRTISAIDSTGIAIGTADSKAKELVDAAIANPC